MGLGPNGNIGNVYIGNDLWDKEWEEAPEKIGRAITSKLIEKLKLPTTEDKRKELQERIIYLKKLGEDYASTT